MRGEILLRDWTPFGARQVLAPGAGYVWAATAGRGPARILGWDRYREGRGEMRWRLLGLVPVMSGSGPDVSRSAAGRLAGEHVLVPAAALMPHVRWRGVDDARAEAGLMIDGGVHRLVIEVDPAGALRSASVTRWGSPGGGAYDEHAFGVVVDAERERDGYVLPSRLRAGWGFDGAAWSFGESYRCEITSQRLV
jgi:hypothetical protein